MLPCPSWAVDQSMCMCLHLLSMYVSGLSLLNITVTIMMCPRTEAVLLIYICTNKVYDTAMVWWISVLLCCNFNLRVAYLDYH